MTYIDAIILGIVQGLTEFLPISSSGHLVIMSKLLDLQDAFVFDVMLNFGTLIALIIYYKNRIWEIIKKLFTTKELTFLAKLLIATIPAGFFGLLFDREIEELNSLVWVVIVMLIIVGLLMIFYGSPTKKANDEELEKSVDYKKAGIIGLTQAVALIPGTSRSGITILAGLRQNLSAAKAAEFSFLLAIPIIFTASMAMFLSDKGQQFVGNNLGMFMVGNLASFVSGFIAVSFLIKVLSRRGLKDFGYYRLALAGILIILILTGVI